MKAQRFNTLRIAGALVLAGLVSGQAMAANSASADASAKIVQPISLTVDNAPLGFGDIIPGASGSGMSTVTLSAANGRTKTGTATLVGTNTSRPTFTVAGEVGLAYTVTLPTSINLSNGSGGLLIVNNFSKTYEQGTGGTISATAPSNMFKVYADLFVQDGQAAGTYTGGFTVSVDYN